MKGVKYFFAISLLAYWLAGCAERVSYEELQDIERVGFLHGFGHGLLFVFSYVLSFFDGTVSAYASYGDEFYASGFAVGVLFFSSGICFFLLALFSRKA